MALQPRLSLLIALWVTLITAAVSFLVKLYQARSTIRRLRQQGLVRVFVLHPYQMYMTADACKWMPGIPYLDICTFATRTRLASRGMLIQIIFPTRFDES